MSDIGELLKKTKKIQKALRTSDLKSLRETTRKVNKTLEHFL